MRLTVQLKLKPDEAQADTLEATLRRSNEAANYASQVAWDHSTFSQYKLHKLVYSDIRSQFDLPSQVAIRVIAKVADAYKLDRKQQRSFKPMGALAFDARNHRVFRDKGYVSISTVDGRLKIPFVCGERQRMLLEYPHGESDLIRIRGQWYLLVTVEVEEPPEAVIEDVIGVDRGIVNVATDSDGEDYSGEQVRQTRQRYAKLRQDLQACGSKSAKRHLRRLSGKERNYTKTLNHTIAKRLVEKARKAPAGIALEDLKGIRGRTTVRREQRYLHNSWPFDQLRQFVEYKAALVGVPVYSVNPKHTSQECPKCGHIERANRLNRDRFRCQKCGCAGPADTIAARNIRARALVNVPIAVRRGSCHSADHRSFAKPGTASSSL